MFSPLRSALILVAAVFAVTAHATPLSFSAVLSGANEVPANASTATGNTSVTYDPSTHVLTVSVTYSGLLGGPASAAHIHASAPPGSNAGVAVGFPGFPAVTSGSYSHVFDLTQATTYSSAFLAANGGTAGGAETALANAFSGGTAYVNIHNATYPGGEIRGYLAQSVPDATGTMWLLAPAIGLLLVCRRGCRRRSP